MEKNHPPFIGGRCLETPAPALGVLVATEVSWLLGPLS